MKGLLLLFALVQIGFAKESATFSPIGFSKDGRYFVFEDFGQTDGAVGSYSVISVVDVSQDKLIKTIKKQRVDLKEPGVATTRRLNLQAAQKYLAAEKIKIVLGNIGKKVALSFPEGNHRFASFGTNQLQLEDERFKDGRCPSGRTLGFRLVLSYPKGTSVLHDDDHVPSGRGDKGCVDGYAIHSVRKYLGYRVIVLTVREPGFEGGDQRHMVVATSALR